MTRDERLDLIDRLRAEADAGRERIAERERARESDPIAFDDWCRAERSVEPIRSAPMAETELPDIIYRTYAPDAPEPAPEPETAAFDEAALLETVARGSAEAVMTLIQRERRTYDRRIATLEGELREVKGMIGSVLALLGQKSDVELPRGFLRSVK
jgi:hypothetical protein